MREIPGKKHNPTIVGWAQRKWRWVKNDETPWCSIAMNAWAQDAGLPQSNRMDARSWLKVGKKVEEPAIGDVAVFWRQSPSSWKGHVGIYMGKSEDNKSIQVLGANQGNMVQISNYPESRLIEYRRL